MDKIGDKTATLTNYEWIQILEAVQRANYDELAFKIKGIIFGHHNAINQCKGELRG